MAWKPPPYESDRAWSVYGASKPQAEREIWEFYKEKKPAFVVNTVLPNTNFGEVLSDKQGSSTAGWVKVVYFGNMDVWKGVLP